MLLYQTLAFAIHGKMQKKLYKNSRFKISLACNNKFDLPEGSYSVSDIQDYFQYIKKNMDKRLIVLQ